MIIENSSNVRVKPTREMPRSFKNGQYWLCRVVARRFATLLKQSGLLAVSNNPLRSNAWPPLMQGILRPCSEMIEQIINRGFGYVRTSNLENSWDSTRFASMFVILAYKHSLYYTLSSSRQRADTLTLLSRSDTNEHSGLFVSCVHSSFYSSTHLTMWFIREWLKLLLFLYFIGPGLPGMTLEPVNARILGRVRRPPCALSVTRESQLYRTGRWPSQNMTPNSAVSAEVAAFSSPFQP